MPNQNSHPGEITRLRQTVDALRAEIDERYRATAALARKNAELYSELQRRLTESESFRLVAEELAVLGERQRLARELQRRLFCCVKRKRLRLRQSRPLLLTLTIKKSASKRRPNESPASLSRVS
jgi:hypothetical protein